MYSSNQILARDSVFNRAGAGTSLLCVAHCLLAPLAASTMPIIAATEEQTHGVFAALVLLLGILSFVPGYRSHRVKSVPLMGFAGIALIIVVLFLPEDLADVETVETFLVIMGGSTLIFVHLRNAYWCRYCIRCRDEEGNCCNPAIKSEA